MKTLAPLSHHLQAQAGEKEESSNKRSSDTAIDGTGKAAFRDRWHKHLWQ
ncbi:hypothetical protein D4764_01G0014100 [Takifugu flavidus]|uniref:Uncharacterized protein n=1 Tax=Takifugu flavidus TaxID=433684 RepID=A0A5C6PQ43_9TELE|nr:hypothetical protein D4764_01G0014100 [Takifugu flavidus]